MSAAQKPVRLPPLKSLRVRNPGGKFERPCMGIMSSVLACWASSGYSATGCAQVEQALRNCMDGPQPLKPKPSEINYHLARFKNKLLYPAKKNKRKVMT
ncbi:mitochondrial ribosomal protein 10 [Hypoxylon sp. NC1633]|nr:mitochondrial ribosomal protein 10 [Hypoxylon sp. NC1633]